MTTNYLTFLVTTLSQTQSNLTTLTKSAEAAAAQFVAGGNLWVAGRQEDFIAEACGRAGGLMPIAPLQQHVPAKLDVILYAVPAGLDAQDMKLTNQWQRQGATVVLFASTAGVYKEHFPVDTVLNVVDLWTWTGEFVAACTRLGKMPVLYQTYGLPGGPERGQKYKGKKFHDDLTIQPIPAERLGREYRQQLETMLAKVRDTQMDTLLKAARWWRDSTSTSSLFTGHMFPRHVLDPRAPKLGDTTAVPAWEDKPLLDPSHLPQCVIYVGYQFAPLKLIGQARSLGVKLVYFDVQPAQPPEPTENILYINPEWPLADACVHIPGYDIPILPASGVLDAAIYWTIAAER